MGLRKTCGTNAQGKTSPSRGCGKTAFYWAKGWKWSNDDGYLCCPSCIAKRRHLGEETNRTAHAEEEQRRASLLTDRGCYEYLQAASARHHEFAVEDIERLPGAVRHALTRLQEGDDRFAEPLLRVYVWSVYHSILLKDGAYNQQFHDFATRLSARLRDVAWSQSRDAIEPDLGAVPASTVVLLSDRLKGIARKEVAESESYFGQTRNEAFQQAAASFRAWEGASMG